MTQTKICPIRAWNWNRTMKCAQRAILLTALIFSPLAAQDRNLRVRGGELRLLSNGEFRAEHGVFFIEADGLHVYSAVKTVFSEETKQWEPIPNDDPMKSRWKGEPFYYEQFGLRQGKWVSEQKGFSTGPSAHLDFGPCDPANQLDLPSAYVRKILPAEAKIKNVSEFSEYATVVFAQTPKQLYPRYSLDAYSLKVSLLIRYASSWQIAELLDIGADGFFCGTRTLSTELPGGKHATVLLLYTDESAASSNYRAIHSFIVGPGLEPSTGGIPLTHSEESAIAKPVDDKNPPSLPEKLVQAVGDAESGLNPNAIHVIPRIENGSVLIDALGMPIADTVNYGLMQINSINIGKTVVPDATNQPFTISEDIKSDWKANARAGVALLAQQYRLARQEQGRSGGEEAYAQQAYSGYNGGTASRRRYREKN